MHRLRAGSNNSYGVVVGFVLIEGQRWYQRSRKQSPIGAVRTEVEFVKGRAQMMLDDNITSPFTE